MNKEELTSKIEKDLQKVCKKHDITNMSFTGTAKDGVYVGILGRTKLLSLFESALNVGRLWQHVRTVVRDKLDDFDRK